MKVEVHTPSASYSGGSTPMPEVRIRTNRFPGARKAELDAPIAEVMTTRVVCTPPDNSIETLSALLTEKDIEGVPVVDSHRRPIGFVTRGDALRQWLVEGEDFEMEPTKAPFFERLSEEVSMCFHTERVTRGTVRDIMSPVVATLPEQATLHRALAVMTHKRVSRIVVTDDRGRVAGMLTSTDIARWLAKEHGSLLP